MRRPQPLPGANRPESNDGSDSDPDFLDDAGDFADYFSAANDSNVDDTLISAEPAPGATDETISSDEQAQLSDLLSQADSDLALAKSAKRQFRDASRARRRAARKESSRFTASLRRRRLSFLLGISGFALVVIFALVFAYGPIFTVRTIQVNGVDVADAAAVSAALQGQQGRALALVNENDIESALAQFPFVASFEVQLHPPHTLVVNLTERIPVGYLENDQNRFLVVDGAGVVLDTLDAPPEALPSLGQIQLNTDAFAAAARVILSLPLELRDQVASVTASTGNDVMLHLSGDGTRILWGSPEESALKLVVLEALMAAQPAPGGLYDVSSPDVALVRP